MGVGLQPLEFTECLADSPAFRENLQRHEKELERTSQQIKRLIKEVKDVVHAAKRLGAAQLALAASMEQFEFACIGASQTEDERVIGRSLHHFAQLVRTIEDERDRMLGRAHEQIIEPLERFRKEHIGAVKEGKKKFDKKTAKFCQSQERTLSLSARKQENVFQEADAAMDMAERDFCQASLEYVFQLQAVQERKKFELVETLLGFVFGWWTFHHTAHDVHVDAEPRVRDLQLRIQRTRSNFEEASKQTESLMKKMMEVRQQSKENCEEGNSAESAGVTRAGYVFLMEKKAFGTAWTKQYCTYEKASRTLSLTPYNQINVKTTSGTESVCVCGARACAEPSERRFCWEAAPEDRERAPLTLQALSDPDRAAWLRALRTAQHSPAGVARPKEPLLATEPTCALDAAGFTFVTRLVDELEARGLEEQGLYRVAGVASKVSRLVQCATDARRIPSAAALRDPLDWETKTLTSALKSYLRALPDPLLTRHLHRQFIAAAKCERWEARVTSLRALLPALPPDHMRMLRIILNHLRNVAAKSDKNLMTSSNLAVCFGPTLLRADTDSVASILELKFHNVLVETLLERHADVFDASASTMPAIEQAPSSGNLLPHNTNGIIRTSPTSIPISSRSDIMVAERLSACGTVSVSGASARYSPHHQQLLQHFTPHPHPHPPAHPHPSHAAPLGALPTLSAHALLHRAAGSTSSSAESVSSHSASPPLVPLTRGAGPAALGRCARVRTLYACLGESEGELSFEPNQIITNVTSSPEPGWLRGTLNGRTGLVPENYVEPLP